MSVARRLDEVEPHAWDRIDFQSTLLEGLLSFLLLAGALHVGLAHVRLGGEGTTFDRMLKRLVSDADTADRLAGQRREVMHRPSPQPVSAGRTRSSARSRGRLAVR